MPGCGAGLTRSTQAADTTPPPCVPAGQWPAWRVLHLQAGQPVAWIVHLTSASITHTAAVLTQWGGQMLHGPVCYGAETVVEAMNGTLCKFV